LIYEYIGEVVAEKTFRKRIQQYADEGIRHFYFMMLQKEEVGSTLSFPHRLKLKVWGLVHRRDEERRDWAIRKPLM